MSTLQIKSAKDGIAYIASKSTIELAEQLCDYTATVAHLKKQLEAAKQNKTDCLVEIGKLVLKLRELAAETATYQCNILEATRPPESLNSLLREVTLL